MKYEIKGENLPVVVCSVEDGETLITESGKMSWMSPNMEMETTSGGGIGKMFGRLFSGESMFQNKYTAQGGEGLIAFASSFPGSIRAVEIDASHPVVVQKRAYLASETGVETSVFFQKKGMAGFFGGEGFIMQKFHGNGTVFLEINGGVYCYDLAAGQSMLIDTGYLAAMEATCSMDIESVKGIGNALLGGEGLFNTRVTGPGKIWLQTMPVNALAGALIPYMPTSSN